MYGFIALVSWLIRQFWIPNPFEALEEGLLMRIGGMPVLLTPEMLNWVVGAILPGITFLVVGFYYDKGSAPAVGSMLYLLVYCVHIFLLRVLSLARFSVWAAVCIAVVYVGCHIVLLRVRNQGLIYRIKH